MADEYPEAREDCCKQAANRVDQPQDPKRKDLREQKCSVCNRSHYEMDSDKAFIGLKPAG